MEKKHYNLIVIGGGAAGFFAAVNAGRQVPQANILLLEKTGKLLSKVKVSGGGRCNVTNSCTSIADMSKCYPRGQRFVKKAFYTFFTTDTVKWFQDRNTRLKAEPDGRMFPVTDDSQTIINTLLLEANKYGVEIVTNKAVNAIKKLEKSFQLETTSGSLQADAVVIACGGFPKSAQFEWLRDLGHQFLAPVPSLFTFNMPGNVIRELMGVSLPEVQIKVAGTKLSESGPVLITHWGLSGPAILRLSAWGARSLADLNYHFTVYINWSPQFNEQTLRSQMQHWRFDRAAQKIANRNPLGFPQRFWDYLLQVSGIDPDIRWADLPAKEQNLLIKNCVAQEHAVKGKTTFKEEFVTCGGIDLQEVDPHTMMSRLVPDLYFAGEILDVDGITGGYNFQHAWSSGFIAAQHFAQQIST